MNRLFELGCLMTVAAASASAQVDPDLRQAVGDTGVGAGWIYEDLDAGYAAAKETGKPLLVAFR